LDTAQLRLSKEAEENIQKHEFDKTTHFAKLGKSFARGGASLLSPSAGRGSGRGSGGMFSPTSSGGTGGRGKYL